MTGLVFATFAKFIEIGKIVNKVHGVVEKPGDLHPANKAQPPTRAEARQELERRGLVNNKRNRKMLEREFLQEEAARGPVKHFSQVQFKPVFWSDLSQFRNLVMKNIEVPAFWHLEHE